MKKQKIPLATYLFLITIAILVITNLYTLSALERLSDKMYSQINFESDIMQYSDQYSLMSKDIPIVSVSSEGKGEIDRLTVKLKPGNDYVLINTDPFAEPDIEYSANQAITAAERYTNFNLNNTNFEIYIDAKNAQLIGGESAGSSISVAAISAIKNWQIRNDTIMTGTIDADGNVGSVGGLPAKAKAASDAGYKYFLIPRGQSNVTYYEKVIDSIPVGKAMTIYRTRYVRHTQDLSKTAKEDWNLTLIEVSNIEDVLDHIIIKKNSTF